MALAYLTINLDAFTGDDHPPVPSYSTITLDPGADHIDAAADVIHVRSIVVSLDRQGKAATANGVPCVDGRVPVVAGVAYAVSAPNILRGGHTIAALTAGQTVDLSQVITTGTPLTPSEGAVLAAQIAAETTARQAADALLTPLTDPRLSDTRTPTAHAASHATGGTDPVTPAAIGAATTAALTAEAGARVDGDAATLASAQAHAQGLVDALTSASPAVAEVLAAPDLNTVTTPGTYYINGSHTNSAIAGGSIVEVAAQAFNTLTQMQSVVGTGRTFRRTCSGGAWTAWSELMTKVDAATPTTLTGVLAGNGSVVAATPSIPVLRNLLPNSSFAGGTTAGWTGNQATLAVSGGILTATAAGKASGMTTAVSGGLVQGRIYYVSARARVQSACQYISTYDGVALVTMQGSPAADAWLDVSAQFTARANYSSVNFYQGFVDAPTAAGKTLDIDYAVAIDLTTVFGAGKEPSKAEMDAIMADLGNWFADTDQKVVPTHSKRFRESAVTNLVRNTYFHTGAAGWIATGATLATSASLATLTGTGSVYFQFAAYDMAELQLGQKGYARAQVRAVSGPAPTNLQLQYGGSPVILASPVVGTWYTISGVVTAPNSGAASSMVVLAQYADAAAANGAVVEFRYPLAINLTATFGAGNEPTASEMDALLAKYPNSNFQGTVNDLFSPVKEYQSRRRGTGSPEGVVTANPGTEWIDINGTNGAWTWLKMSGSGNTGWRVTVGDTGWRSMTADWNVSPRSSGDGWVTRLLIRRVGNRITLACYLASAFGSGKDHSVAAFIPAGFRNTSSLNLWPQANRFRITSSQINYVDPALETGTAGNLRIINPSTAHEAYSEPSWLTDNQWPTTLPGTPA